MICRHFPHESADGPHNMGLDQALLESVDADPSAAIVRTYEWSEPTLSLGYFQSVEALEKDSRWNKVPMVRRPSGGGALWHHHELTYALIVPRSHALARKPAHLYRAVHAALGNALIAAGIPAVRRGDFAPVSSQERPFLCFLDRDPEDVLVAGAKVIGSAQRRRPAAVLQHGSILLAKSATTPELPGLLELADWRADRQDLACIITASIADLLGMKSRWEEVPQAVRDHAAELAVSVYQNPLWTRRR